MPSDKEILSYKIIRQPYRITMARWDFTVTQKRILTKIISMLQQEISFMAKGASVKQLELFSTSDDSIKLQFSLNDIVKASNNYAHVKTALQGLRNIDVQIVLPATKSKTSGRPGEETVLTGLIERSILTKHSRSVSIVIHKATAAELINAANGLTRFAEEVMYLTDNSYTQKLYEMISHWKDQEVFTISPDDFREKLSLKNKYPQLKDLIRRVVKSAEKELKEIADVYFVFKPSVSGRRITKFNFIIKHRKVDLEIFAKADQLRNDSIYLLKTHLFFNEQHLEQIYYILSNDNFLSLLRVKIIEISDYITDVRNCPDRAIKDIPKYVIKSLINSFPP